MKVKSVTVLLILAVVLPIFLNMSLPAKADIAQTLPSLFVGVDVAYESVTATEQLIDKISSYSNTFVIGCNGNNNETRLTTLSKYAYDKGMSFIVYSDSRRYPSQQWLADANSRWGDKFLGIYWFDEEGGKQLDQQNYPPVTAADNYSDAATKYVSVINAWVRGNHSITQRFAYPTQYKLFTSDYAFYWYDYQAGYDTVFAQFGWNYSRQVNIAQCRGAATAFNKDWGAIITWTYRQPPYIESGPELYKDMVLAYQNGAKYILIFDSNKDYSQSILQQEHLDAMKQFWQFVQDNPRTIAPSSARTAYVLPKDYAYGFRGPTDRIWGLWGPDELTNAICQNVSNLLLTYGTNLDIIYPDTPQAINSIGYQNIFYAPNTQQNEIQKSPNNEVVLPEIYMLAAIGFAVIATVAIVSLKFRKNQLKPSR
jgi:hypothetical protein